MGDCEQMVRRMKPVAKKLESLSEEIMSTGDTILNRLQFIPRTLSQGDVPGQVNPEKLQWSLIEYLDVLDLTISQVSCRHFLSARQRAMQLLTDLSMRKFSAPFLSIWQMTTASSWTCITTWTSPPS